MEKAFCQWTLESCTIVCMLCFSTTPPLSFYTPFQLSAAEFFCYTTPPHTPSCSPSISRVLWFIHCTSYHALPFFKRVWLAFFTSNTNSATVCFSVSSRTILSTFTMLILLTNLTFYVPLSLLTVLFLFLCRTARSKLIMKQFNGNNACIAKILHLCRLKGNSLH